LNLLYNEGGIFLKKTFLILIIFILLTACGTSKPLPDGNTINTTTKTETVSTPAPTPAVTEAKITDYFAYTKDTHMKFKGTGNEYASFDTYVEYIKDNIVQIRNSNGGTDTVEVYQVKDGAIRKVFRQGETYYNYDYTSSLNMDEILLKEPIKVGTSWTVSNGANRSITAVDKRIKTPSGEYDALEITTKFADSTIKDYCVKNIGYVKSEFISNADIDNDTNNDNDTNIYAVTSELELVEKGVPIRQTIRFYYPEFSKDRVVYIDRAVDIRTNEDMKLLFQNELKKIPENSGLSKVLSPNTSILSCVVDDKNETVTVDFSSELLKEMNAGSSFETMLLKSITNTFGNYYQKNKVIIKVEGKLYESGHFLLKEGESYTVKIDDVQEYKKP
jgi:hypothetical protein